MSLIVGEPTRIPVAQSRAFQLMLCGVVEGIARPAAL
jgi:hypothetical protein